MSLEQARRLSDQFFHRVPGQADESAVGTQDHPFGIGDDHAFLSIKRGGGYAQFSIRLVQRLALPLQVGLDSFATLDLLRECEVMFCQLRSMAIGFDEFDLQPRRILTHSFEADDQHE